ncbi:MAG: class I SAM-dependent methyltransferase [Desulfuromonadales bacterium]
MSTGLKVHLGAFDKAIEGWLNTDVTPHIWVAKVPFLPYLMHAIGFLSAERFVQHRHGVFGRLHYMDLTKPLPFKDASVAVFFSSHVLEHLFLDEVQRLIPEMYRCLQQEGVCRVVVPDLEKIVALFDPQNPRPFLYDMYEVASRSAVKNTHHSGFTSPFLLDLFRSAGFREVDICDYRVGRCPDLEKLDNRPNSLFSKQ